MGDHANCSSSAVASFDDFRGRPFLFVTGEIMKVITGIRHPLRTFRKLSIPYKVLASLCLMLVLAYSGGVVWYNASGQAARDAQKHVLLTSQPAASQPAAAPASTPQGQPTTTAASSGAAPKGASLPAAPDTSCRWYSVPYQTTTQYVSPSNWQAGTTSLGLDGENSVCTTNGKVQPATVVYPPTNNIRYVADASLATPSNTYKEPADQYCAAYAATSYFYTCMRDYAAQ